MTRHAGSSTTGVKPTAICLYSACIGYHCSIRGDFSLDRVGDAGERTSKMLDLGAGPINPYPPDGHLGMLNRNKNFAAGAYKHAGTNKTGRMPNPFLQSPTPPPPPPPDREGCKMLKLILPTSVADVSRAENVATCDTAAASTNKIVVTAGSDGGRPKKQTSTRASVPTARPKQQQQEFHPLGVMFTPELDKAGLVAVVSEVLCRPGYTTGPEDEKRLLRQIKSGRVDLRTMSRLLRWFQRGDAKEALLERGLRFVGPLAAAQPYTTGLGVSWLLREVARMHPAGSRIIVCFSSSYDACAGTIAGLLVDDLTTTPTNTPPPTPPPTSPASPASPASPTGTSRRSTPTVTPTKTSGQRQEIGSRVSRQAGVEDSGIDANGSTVAAFLLDRRPTHVCHNHDPGNSDSGPDSVEDARVGIRQTSPWKDVARMRVREWVEAYGECDGPMLAAWVFQGCGME